MTVVLDASMLILLFDGKARAPIDEATGRPVADCQDRLRFFLETQTKPKGARVLIPAPALGEFLVRIEPAAAGDYLAQLQRLRGCEIVPFGIRAAIEFAEMQRARLQQIPRRQGSKAETRAKAKFDQQIVAIALMERAGAIYSDDKGLAAWAAHFGIETIGIARLPLSPTAAQATLPLEPPGEARPRPPLDDLP